MSPNQATPNNFKMMNPKTVRKPAKGFALVITLSLMVLLTLIAVGLLTLSSISLRTAGQGNDMAIARANARLALMLAIGELQKTAGPDKRITAPANLLNASAQVGVANASMGITGVWNSSKESYNNTDYHSSKTGKNFLGYLISNPNPQTAPDPKMLPDDAGKSQKLVGSKSVGIGNTTAEISAPLVAIAGTKANATAGEISWVTLDEGMKGCIDLLPATTPASQGESVTQVGSAARNGFQTVEKMNFLKADNAKLMASLPKLITLNEAGLAADSTDAVAKYFHDFTIASKSLQVDVANGGLKTDLSVLFDGAFGAAVPSAYANRYLYSDSNAPFQGSATTSDVQWSLYANYSRLYRRTTVNDNPKDGLKVAIPPNYSLKAINDRTIKQIRYEPNMATLKQPLLMPTVVRVDTVFSIITRDYHAGHGNETYPYQLDLMYLPVITLHNPYNVPIRVNGLQMEFSDIPLGFEFLINGQPCTTGGMVPINKMSLNHGGDKKTFNMQFSNSLGTTGSEVVIGAGETRIFGTPFRPDLNWQHEVDTNGSDPNGFFDWDNTQTGAKTDSNGNRVPKLTTPGLITSPTDGVGFDLDFIAPGNHTDWYKARSDFGTPILKADDTIQVRYGPVIPDTASSTNAFSVTVRMVVGSQTTDVGTTQIFYGDVGKLTKVVAEGTSPRFTETRSFPAIWPRAGESPKTTMQIHEDNATPVKLYSQARPFAVFSLSAKTTMESFTKSRPLADTGMAMQMATCDFTSTNSEGSSPMEVALVPVKSGGLVIESGGITNPAGTSLQGFFFGGHGTTNGTPNATLYEIPMAPLQSIAQLRHANGGSIGSIPYVTYTVGESRAHPALTPDVAFFKTDTSRVVLDHSWLANDQLWDRYWFSTLSTLQGVAYTGSAATTQAQLATDFFAGSKPLPNRRNMAYIPDGKTAADTATAAKTATGTQSAAYIITQGGFNVNSTSVPAWISVLSGLAKSDVPLAGGTTEKIPPGTPFLRIRQPVNGSASAIDLKSKLWNSYRTLNDEEIKKLAVEIVTEVKARGPFLSMAEFVNRRLGPSSDLTNKGAIQAALDRAKINTIMESNSRPVAPADTTAYGWKNSDAVAISTGAGAPGEVSQGDVLSAIGSFVTVRSDTFKIRAYGDAKNVSGKVTARAWCEATIQRIPGFLDSSDLPETAMADLKSPINLVFGRQFKVTSFRWLHPDEI